MNKALIPVEMTLASNIALRYACQKSEILGIGLQPIHIEEPDHKAHSSETGWIRKSWESGLKQAGMDQVRQILLNEDLDCFIMPNPIVEVGDREDILLQELRLGDYDLFVEGEISNFNTGEFRKKLRSKLYRKMPCPALVVKNIIKSNRMAIVVDSRTDLESVVDQLCGVLQQRKIDFDLCVYSLDDFSHELQPEDIIGKAKALLAKRGQVPKRAFTLLTAPEKAALEFHEYGMIVSAVDRNSTRKSPLVEVLARVSCPLLLCWTYTSGRSK
ncbi:universal stress protein [Maridesulfovibrio sp. FT414]|uniref:universal stress protein n=1 Tax=Maridesulfovibrio sp. FT414 TaxID=2979469 RepID=UPI003D8081DA